MRSARPAGHRLSDPRPHPAQPRTSRARRWVVLLATLVTVALTARLGVWQLSRAAQKLALQAQLDSRSKLAELDATELARTPQSAAEQHYRRVRLRGRWVAERTVFLDNRQMKGVPGFFVMTPLALDDGGVVLVQRGWAPRNFGDRAALPRVPTPAGEIDLRGLVAPSPARLYEFAAAASGSIRQNLDLAQFSAETALRLLPLTVWQLDSASSRGDGLARSWALPALDVDKHYGYAFQWFAMSMLAAGLYVWYQVIRPRRQHRC